MKIAVLGTRGFPDIQGGVETHCQNLYPHLVKRGCEVTVFSRRPYVLDKNLSEYRGVKLVPISCPKNKSLEAFWHTFLGVFAAKRMRADILHVQAVGPSLLVPLARFLGLKVVMTHHGHDYRRKKWGKVGRFALKKGERSAAKWANSVISVSEDISSELKRMYNRQSVVIPNGVNLREVVESTKILKEFGLQKNKYILSVGRFVPEKGFLDLIEAFELLSKEDNSLKNTGWKLVIAGKPDHHTKYSREIERRAKNNPDIVLTGFLSGHPLTEIFSHAAIFVMPSHHEGLPIVLLEALSFGLATLVSDIKPNHNFGIEEKRFFPAGNVDSLTRQLTRLMHYPLTRKEKDEQITRIREQFDWAKIADSTLAVYRTVLKNV